MAALRIAAMCLMASAVTGQSDSTNATDATNSTGIAFCATDNDCRTFGDDMANCTAGACACSNDDSAYCSGDVIESTLVNAVYVFSYNYDCGSFFGSSALSALLRDVVSSVGAAKGFSVATIFSCGSTNAVSRVTLPLDEVVPLAEETTAALDVATVGTDLEGLRTSTTVQIQGASRESCPLVAHPVASYIYLSEGNCVAGSCHSGFQLQASAPDYRAACVSVGGDVDGDDDLSKGAIAAIVVGAVMGVMVIGGLVYLVVTPKGGRPTELNQENEPIEGTIKDTV